jgi:uncharacterized protein (TIRG00374 family)
MTKNSIKIILKFVFAFGILYWLVDSGKLDFKILMQTLDHPARLLAAFGLILINLMIVTWRWKYILDFKSSKKLPFMKIAKYNWIGLFFNSVLPGSVTGDIVKAFYLKELDSTMSNRFVFGSVLIDRFVGLFGLILLLGGFTLLNYKSIASLDSDMHHLMNINMLLFAGVVIGFLSLYFFEQVPRKILEKVEHINLLHNIGHKLLGIWQGLCDIRSRLILLTLISICVHAIAVFVFWFITNPFADGPFDFTLAFSFVPIGFVTIAIPIAPAGLGVGHAVFHKLFTYFGINNGASLFNIYFFLQLFGNLIGIIPYVTNKTSKSLTEMNNEAEAFAD